MWEPDSKEPSGHHVEPDHTKPSNHSTQEPVLIIGDQCVSTCMLVCVCESGLRSEYGSWNPEDIYREKKQEWHTHLLNFNEEAMLFDRLTTAYLNEASIPVTTKSLSPLLVKPISEWTTSPATNSAEKKKKQNINCNNWAKGEKIHYSSNLHKSGLQKNEQSKKKKDDEDGIRTHACRAQ